MFVCTQFECPKFDPIRCYHSRPECTGSDCNEGILCSSQSSYITGASSWDCLMSYPGHSLRCVCVCVCMCVCEWGLYSYAEMQSVYSTAPIDWVTSSWIHSFPKSISSMWKCKLLRPVLELSSP